MVQRGEGAAPPPPVGGDGVRGPRGVSMGRCGVTMGRCGVLWGFYGALRGLYGVL